MEELNLQALEQEYKSLKETVAGLRGRESAAETTLEAAREAAGEANNAFVSAKSAYEMMINLYEANIKSNKKEDGTPIVPVETYNSIKEEAERLKAEMEAAEAEKQAKEAAAKEAENAFTGIQNDAKIADERMNLILASFGANEKINKALVNEFENTYFDKIEKVKTDIDKLDSLKTQISADEDLRKLLFGDKDAGIEGLDEILVQFKEAAEKGPSKEFGEINKKAVAQYKLINSRLKKLGLKGVTLSNEEINRMLTEKDDQGRMVVPEIDRRIDAENVKISTLEAERDSIIEVMGITFEMSKDPVNGTPELQSLLEETAKLQSEVSAAQKRFDESSSKLAELGTEKAGLTTKIEELKTANPDYAEIAALEAEIASAGTVASVTNPEYAAIKAEMDKIKEELDGATEVDNPEYALQKEKVDAAQLALDEEEGNMTPSVEQEGDEIVNNYKYRMANDALEYAQENFDKTAAANPELANLYEEILTAEDNVAVSKNGLKDAEDKEEEAFKNLTKNYVSKTVYKDLDNADSPASKALEQYRAAELAVREAMLAYQNDPSKENKEKLEACMKTYNELAETFKAALKDSVGGKGELPSTEAIHNYLLHVLNKEKPTDKAYNIKNASNRIALLERDYKNTDKSELVSDLSKSSKSLDKLLPMLLSGEVKMNGDAFQLAMQDHEAAMGKFGDDKASVISRLNGTGPVVDPKTLKWWQKLFNMMPREKVAYDFKPITKPAEYSEWDAAKKATSDAKFDLEADKRELDDLTKDLDDDQKAKIDAFRMYDRAIDSAAEELDRTPEKVNKTKIARLKAALAKEQDILGKTPAKKSTVDRAKLELKLAELEEKIKTVPEFTSDTKDVDAKKARLAELKGKNPNAEEIAMDEKRLQDILLEEASETQKNKDADEVLKKKKPILASKLSRLSLLQKIKDRFKGVTEFIKIKDAGKMSDNRSKIARTLADDTKSKAEEDAER